MYVLDSAMSMVGCVGKIYQMLSRSRIPIGSRIPGIGWSVGYEPIRASSIVCVVLWTHAINTDGSFFSLYCFNERRLPRGQRQKTKSLTRFLPSISSQEQQCSLAGTIDGKKENIGKDSAALGKQRIVTY